MNAAIAQHLNIAESLIAEIQEWASVLWVRFVSGRPRFVSKKVVAKMEMPVLTGTEKQVAWAADIRADFAKQVGEWIERCLPGQEQGSSGLYEMLFAKLVYGWVLEESEAKFFIDNRAQLDADRFKTSSVYHDMYDIDDSVLLDLAQESGYTPRKFRSKNV